MKARSFKYIATLDPIAHNFICNIAVGIPTWGPSSTMTMCCPDFKGKRHSYMTILQKIIANGGIMRRKDIFGQDKYLPIYGVWDYKHNCLRKRRPTETIDRNRGRGSCTFARLKDAGLVTSTCKGYQITDVGRMYVNIMNTLNK